VESLAGDFPESSPAGDFPGSSPAGDFPGSSRAARAPFVRADSSSLPWLRKPISPVVIASFRE
jgi:hypothetical protein